VGRQKRANIQNVKAGPMVLNNTGISSPMIAVHVTKVAIDIARPLIFVGYISERMTQATGPREKEKEAMKMRIKLSRRYPCGVLSIKSKPMGINDKSIPEIPAINKGFLPILSIFYIAINVNIMFANPIIT
jgi:hypothetical protein